MVLLTIILLMFLAFIIIYLYQSQRLHGPFINFLIAVSILLFILSLGFVYFSSSANISSFDGVLFFVKSYMAWVGSIFKGGVNVVGYAINQNWGVNSTI